MDIQNLDSQESVHVNQQNGDDTLCKPVPPPKPTTPKLPEKDIMSPIPPPKTLSPTPPAKVSSPSHTAPPKSSSPSPPPKPPPVSPQAPILEALSNTNETGDVTRTNDMGVAANENSEQYEVLSPRLISNENANSEGAQMLNMSAEKQDEHGSISASFRRTKNASRKFLRKVKGKIIGGHKASDSDTEHCYLTQEDYDLLMASKAKSAAELMQEFGRPPPPPPPMDDELGSDHTTDDEVGDLPPPVLPARVPVVVNKSETSSSPSTRQERLNTEEMSIL